MEGGIDAAVTAARAADVVVLAIGEAADMSAEAQSRTDIVIPAPQRALAEAVAAAGRPILVLLKTGRALELPDVVKDSAAILVTWFLGSEEGHAIADLVFGDHAPSGRLPVSFPQKSGQQPYYYSHKTTGRPELPEDKAFKARYRETSHRALYPFGHGLGYALVTYGPARLSSDVLRWGGEITATVRIANAGERAVEEVVQLYIRDKVASLTRPGRELKGFRRVHLEPGEGLDVAFNIRRDDLSFIGRDMKRAAEPGAFDLWLVLHAEAGLPATFTLVR